MLNKKMIGVKFKEFSEEMDVTFSVDTNKYLIAKLKEIPRFSDKIFSIIKDKNEITVIAKKGLESIPISEQKFFKLVSFNVKFPFNLTGFLSYVSTALASENIPIFVISSYSTDHILVIEKNLDKTIETLEKIGIMLS
jgi:hypothetical protein